MFRAILHELGEPGIDLFATCLNHKLPVYVSHCPDPKALALDALSLDWNTLPLVYAFPPMPILPKVLQKMKASTCWMILIVPAWPAKSWFPDLLYLSGALPLELLSGASLPDRRSSDVVPPEPSDVQLPRLDVVWSSLSQRGILEKAAKCIAVPQRSSTRLVYEGKWAEFCAWCDRRKEDPVQASVPLVADFLTGLFERNPPLAVSTISHIPATVPYGPSLTNSHELGALMGSFGIDHPVTLVFYPGWSLRVVLNFLMKPPFEPIAKCSLENLTLKTVFLVALASGRHCSELCALSSDPECFRFSPNLAQVQLLMEPGFLAKT